MLAYLQLDFKPASSVLLQFLFPTFPTMPFTHTGAESNSVCYYDCSGRVKGPPVRLARVKPPPTRGTSQGRGVETFYLCLLCDVFLTV